MKTKLITGSMLLTTLLLTVGCTNSYMNTNKSKNTVHSLSDSKNMTLYTFDKDSINKSNCYGGCEKKWPVFNGSIDTMKLPKGVMASNFGTTTRKNGTMQTTYDGKPLYYFFMDKNPLDMKGDGKKGVWHIVK